MEERCLSNIYVSSVMLAYSNPSCNCSPKLMLLYDHCEILTLTILTKLMHIQSSYHSVWQGQNYIYLLHAINNCHCCVVIAAHNICHTT